VAKFSLAILARAAQHQHRAALIGHRLGAPRDVGEERVGDVDDYHADGAATTGAQLTRGLIADEAQPVDDFQHALAPGRSDHLRTVEHVAHGSHRHTRLACHLFDAGARHGPPLVVRPSSEPWHET
jgi:hypothetical protein